MRIVLLLFISVQIFNCEALAPREIEKRSLIGNIVSGGTSVLRNVTSEVESDISNTINKVESGISDTISQIIPSCNFGVQATSIVLFTRNNMNGEEIYLNDTNIPLRPGGKVVFLIHGFISEANNTNFYNLANEWLKIEDLNILAVDWKKSACSGGLKLLSLLSYSSAVQNVDDIGHLVANYTGKLKHQYNVSLDNILVVGHSLGAHVSGFAGKALQKLEIGRYPKIIGLDPAGPLFSSNDCSERLCKSDADLVTVYHTSSSLGMTKPIADLDLYFNNGDSQPGCGLDISCSHSRSVLYFGESVTNKECTFIGRDYDPSTRQVSVDIEDCTDKTCIEVGPNEAEQIARGSFYIETNRNPPFCKTQGQ